MGFNSGFKGLTKICETILFCIPIQWLGRGLDSRDVAILHSALRVFFAFPQRPERFWGCPNRMFTGCRGIFFPQT